uniref:protein O-GlcNAcase n=1 Tax=Ceriodaphnia reticulata TaxID=302197 RepID=A0A4Y7LYY2_9CRUS|nr:EOG090X01OH [Ceriodaphnia reticulata]SVE72785.1 EOG090X01OH [Ceriodaphnia reticulata]
MQQGNTEDAKSDESFICGVVEGFYGRPWTLDQRKDLFVKLQEWGMNSYLYAPKDDYKHRAYWRELYSVEEAEHLTTLIATSKECNINFFYALSPGLDITYSSAKEMVILKRKLDQVAQFGCTAFALLFDDIEAEMTESDKEAFQSFAQAQVSVTNEIYEHLNQPKGFLFCPTQYCGSRAVPDVPNSEYLNTIGSKLAPGIDVMWTGPKVISRVISPASIDEIAEVLRRKPVIWDNLHANDYDQKRIFLGPYSGRSSALLTKLKGVLTNPNCEYGANFVAIHTVAQWSKCNVDTGLENQSNDAISAVSADIKLEQESRSGRSEDEDPSLPMHIYHPRLALKKSLLLWLPEFKRTKSMWGPISKPHVSNVPPVTFNSSGQSAIPCSSTSSLEEGGASPGSAPMPTAEHSSEEANELASDATLTPCLVDGTESAESASMVSLDRVAECLEPMETVESASSASSIQAKNLDVEDVDDDNNKESPLKEEMPGAQDHEEGDIVMESERKEEEEDYQLTVDDLCLLCDVFYLPFEHGPQGMQLLQEFNWLKLNAHLVASNPSKPTAAGSPEVKEWHHRAEKFDTMSRALNRLFTRLTYINNRELLYELYPYVWDMRGVVALLNSYVKWLSFNQGSKPFLSGEQEPWVFRGGLAADLQRLLPLESVNDLFLYKTPETPTRQVYTIRPYLASDERSVYELCRRLHLARVGATSCDMEKTLHSYPDLLGDIYFGAFVTLSPQLCFVVEDDHSVVGFVAAAANAKELQRQIRVAWIPDMQSKYPELFHCNSVEDANIPVPLKDLTVKLQRLHSEDLPDALLTYHPSQLKMWLSDTVIDHSVSKRLLTCAVAALRAHGSSGCHVYDVDVFSMDFYSRLGFVELKNVTHDQEIVYFGRIF